MGLKFKYINFEDTKYIEMTRGSFFKFKVAISKNFFKLTEKTVFLMCRK